VDEYTALPRMSCYQSEDCQCGRSDTTSCIPRNTAQNARPWPNTHRASGAERLPRTAGAVGQPEEQRSLVPLQHVSARTEAVNPLKRKHANSSREEQGDTREGQLKGL